MESSLPIGRFLGTEVRLHWSWFVLFLLVSWSVESNVFGDRFPEWTGAQTWGASVLMALLLFASVLCHELAHSLVARGQGLTVTNITLFIFGGVANLAREPQTWRQEFLVTTAGPAASLALAAVWFVLWAALSGVSEAASVLLGYLAVINLALGIFNLLPGFPLDGGRIVRSIVWGLNRDLLKATRWVSVSGLIIAYSLVLAGLVMTFTVSLGSGLWFVLVGWFLRNASESTYQRTFLRDTLGPIKVRTLVKSCPNSVAPTITPRELVDKHIVPEARRCFPVRPGPDSELVGLVTLSDIQDVGEDEFDTKPVSELMTPIDELITISPDQNAFHALQMMAREDVHQLPVLAKGQLEGFVTRADILAKLPPVA